MVHFPMTTHQTYSIAEDVISEELRKLIHPENDRMSGLVAMTHLVTANYMLCGFLSLHLPFIAIFSNVIGERKVK